MKNWSLCFGFLFSLKQKNNEYMHNYFNCGINLVFLLLLFWSCLCFFLREVDRPLQFSWNPCCSLFPHHYAVNEHIHFKVFAIASSATERKLLFPSYAGRKQNCICFHMQEFLNTYILRNGVLESGVSHLSAFAKHCLTAFQSGCTSFCSCE